MDSTGQIGRLQQLNWGQLRTRFLRRQCSICSNFALATVLRGLLRWSHHGRRPRRGQQPPPIHGHSRNLSGEKRASLNEPTPPSLPDEWKERTAFREIFLVHASAGGAPLRRFGRYMYETILQSGLPGAPAPPVHARFLAVAEDLRFSGQVLADLAAEADEDGVTAEESALAMKASSWAREVSELVRAIEGAAGAGGPR